MPPRVRFGSKADIRVAKSHVRFTPKSGHLQRKHRCPLRANSGHRVRLFDRLVRSKQHRLRNGETEFFSDFGVYH